MEEEFFVSEYRMSKEIKKEDYDFHSHDTYEVYFFHSGRCKYMIGDEIHHLQENDIIIMDGLTLHRPYPEEEATLYPKRDPVFRRVAEACARQFKGAGAVKPFLYAEQLLVPRGRSGHAA